MAVPPDQREAAVRKVFEPLKKSVDEDIFDYIVQSAADTLQDAADRKECAEDLEEALVPHLEAASVDDPSGFVKKLLDAIFPAEKKAAAKKAAAKDAGSKTSAKAGAKAGGKAAAGGYPAEQAFGDVCTDPDVICRVERLILMYGGSLKPLLNNTMFELVRGRRYGVVGRNGAGKTTLMSRVAIGDMTGMTHLKCYHLAHEGILDNIDKLTTCDGYVKIMCKTENQKEKVAKALAEVGFDDAMYAKAVGELSGGWKMRLALACAILQGADVFLLDEPTNHLDKNAVKWLQDYLVREGGKSTAMIISHDAGFLNHVCTHIVHFTDNGKLEYHEGNFDAFRKTKGLDMEGAAQVLAVRNKKGQVDEAETAEAPTAPAPMQAGDDHPEDHQMKFPIPGKIEGLGSQGKPVATVTNLNFRYFDDSPLVLKDVTVRLTMNSRIGVVGANGAGKSTLLNLLAGELLPPDDEMGEASSVFRHRNLRLSYIAQHHFTHLSEFTRSTPLHYMQVRFRHGWDEEAQKRLTLPQNEEEAQFRRDMAIKHGKRSKEVDTLLSRQKQGKILKYEVKWKGLDDAKQNTYESVQKLRLLGVEKMAAALDDRIACAETGLRPLTTREIVKHLEPFGINEDMTTHRMIGSFSAGQKSKLMLGASMWIRPHVIAFDEPTNYLDFQTVQSLARAINFFKGGTIVVTHNEEFLKSTCEEIWDVQDGMVNVVGKEGIGKKNTQKNDAARIAKEKVKMEAKASAEVKEASGPTEAEKALQVYLAARKKLGAAKQDIKLMGIDLRAPDGTELLVGTDFMLNSGRRYGLVGRNGAGKSTLLRELAYYQFDKFPKNMKVLMVEQEVRGDARKPVEWVLDSDVEHRTLLAEQKELQAKEGADIMVTSRIKEIASRLEEIGASTAEARAAKILRGLQFSDELMKTPTASLSGGWRMRVSLASALFAQPELLLLDEPTNHLDFPAVIYLEEYLKTFKNKIIIVSHDRGFLNNVCTDIVLLNGRKLAYYKGDYDTYIETVRQSRLAQQRAYETQQKEIAHILEFINKIDNRPKIVAQKMSKQKVLDHMEKIEDPTLTYADSSSLSIKFPSPGQLPKSDMIQTDNISFAYEGGRTLFEGATVSLAMKGRIGILGANGAGKSTLLKIMQGKLTPQKGGITVNKNMRVGYFAQHHVDGLELTMNCVDCVQANFPGMSDQEARSVLGRFGISGDIALRKVITLSGGQKSRVALAVVTHPQPHLIYLDEPTNHLDMETIDALIEAIQSFEGSVVMVSHDQYFLSKVATEFWSVAGGKVSVFRDMKEAKAATYTC